MSGQFRAYLIIILGTVAAVCAVAKTVDHWTLPLLFGAVEVGAIAMSNGLQKAPREAAAQDVQAAAVAQYVPGQLLDTREFAAPAAAGGDVAVADAPTA